MKRKWLISALSLIFCLIGAGVNADYEVGQVVTDFSWQESDGGTPVTNSVHSIIDSGKVFVLVFGSEY